MSQMRPIFYGPQDFQHLVQIPPVPSHRFTNDPSSSATATARVIDIPNDADPTIRRFMLEIPEDELQRSHEVKYSLRSRDVIQK